MIGVLIQRRSDFTILGSTLDAMTTRGLEWRWVLDFDGKENPLSRDFLRWGSPDPLIPTVRALADCDVLLAKETPSIPWIARPTVTIPYFWDDRLHRAPPEHFVCYNSERHREFVAAIHGPRDPAYSPVVGWTMADHLSLLSSRGPRPYGVLFTMKQCVPERWRRSLRGRSWYRETCKMVAAEWRLRGWNVNIKSREKHGDPRWLPHLGTYWVDELMYPHTSWLLMVHAQEIVHFGSGVAWQAMVAGVPYRAYRVPHSHLDGLPGQADIERTLDGTVSREEFLRDWIGVLDGKAGDRVVDVIEGLL